MRMKQLALTLLAGILVWSGCMEKDVYQPPQKEEKEYNEFNFSTVAPTTSLEVAYLNTGVQAGVYFELYGEKPVTEGEYGYIKREDVTPLFAAYTARDGVFRGTINDFPAYLKKVYIYTPAFYAQTLIEADVENGVIKAMDDEITEDEGPATRIVSKGNGDSYMVKTPRPDAYEGTIWKTWLGDYNRNRNGEIEYKYKGDKLSVKNANSLYEVHSRVINIHKTCPEEYRSYTDMYVNEDAEVAITFLGQNTCWNCSMGYYYYKEGEKPASLNDANVIMLFPNTQDGYWGNNEAQRKNAKKTAGIDRGTAVQLKYYPNIAQGSYQGETNVFPAGYRIGFVIANNAWSNRIPGYTGNNRYRSATSEGLSVDNNGKAIDEPRTAAYRYGDYVMISFEDYKDDQNFSDIVITLKSNPVEAITDIPVVNPDNDRTTTTVLKGIYAFEDQWPAKGDYDLNDVMVRYHYGKTFDSDNNIYSEAFLFQTFQNYASLVNGLAFQLDDSVNPSSVKYEIRKKGEKDFTETQFAYESADRVYRLTDDIRTDLGAEYKVTLVYDKPIAKESKAKPFLYRNTTNGKRLEVHLPGEAPTSLMDRSYFGQNDDASVPEKGVYFVRAGKYPFAFFLSGAEEKDLKEMLDRANEGKNIDVLYPEYNAWAESGGKTNQDWYKK